jgi:hypothetical protein
MAVLTIKKFGWGPAEGQFSEGVMSDGKEWGSERLTKWGYD